MHLQNSYELESELKYLISCIFSGKKKGTLLEVNCTKPEYQKMLTDFEFPGIARHPRSKG